MLSDDLDRYFALRRAVGFKLDIAERWLRRFASFAAERRERHVRIDTALEWGQSLTPTERKRRLEELAMFARYARAEDDLLDVTGPWEVLRHANDVLERTAYEIELVGPGGPTLRTRHGLLIAGVRPLPAKGRRLPDVAIIAGGSPATPVPDAQARLVSWLRRRQHDVARLHSIPRRHADGVSRPLRDPVRARVS